MVSEPCDSLSLLVSTLLTVENHHTWRRSMKKALNGKNKLGFVDGLLTKPNRSPAESQLWDRCNDKVFSWILNSIDKSLHDSLVYYDSPRDIWIDLEGRFSQSNNPHLFRHQRDLSTLQQGGSTITEYYHRIKSLWDELEALSPPPSCSCGALKDLKASQSVERVF
ncbi:uncharacterized protein LOC111366849 [Olea europaea var. sylvestris]|uniref:uncharacterized protein LOC111366849 n=1 Tax=Olea europaea var. sylvestris TaxID=158386 RepID=UPI000C1CDD68|nr:uncharacterized protein LOC111366849 [Olea europaea var. sylvestris]